MTNRLTNIENEARRWLDFCRKYGIAPERTLEAYADVVGHFLPAAVAKRRVQQMTEWFEAGPGNRAMPGRPRQSETLGTKLFTVDLADRRYQVRLRRDGEPTLVTTLVGWRTNNSVHVRVSARRLYSIRKPKLPGPIAQAAIEAARQQQLQELGGECC